ncbi:pantoate--beta-alanine ligase [Sediminibacter sp. Hel_I_10]|uniref:pantoate--beta-alanine ligase n=1 Tax=Sediminibacter sp. Hel_I_10 TaxID=1392490 RepID=UPI00047C3B2B|nr:pantoate--beta-alanine ligase [Sediminibacter sp. Hel_I_10]
MIVFDNKRELTTYLDELKRKGLSLGFVPTMGALHDGHSSLILEGLQDNTYVVVSIFVNPTQFNNNEDLEKYPRTLEKDVSLLQTISEDRIIVYSPRASDIYGEKIASEHFDFDGLEHEMEGRFRPGHFDGVGTVVKRLFEIVKPDRAYFGKKDYQQLMILKKLVSKHDLGVKVIGCDIFRADDGLAMSSRNERLSKAQRAAAPFIYKTLNAAKAKFGTNSAKEITDWMQEQFENHELLTLEYFLIADAETLKTIKQKSTNKSYRAFIAVYAGEVRLIDNIALN